MDSIATRDYYRSSTFDHYIQLILALLKVISRRLMKISDESSLMKHLFKSLMLAVGTPILVNETYNSNLNILLTNKVFIFCTVDGPQFTRNQYIKTDTLHSPGIPERPYHSFLAGAFGGYFVWGRYSGVNYQLLLYLASRIIVASIKLASEKGVKPFASKRFQFPHAYPWAAAGIWGVVMMLFEEHPDMLHPSLKRSMDEIYRFNLSIH